MDDPSTPSRSLSPAERAAAEWVWRIGRGLSPAEQDELFAWMAAHPDHTRALARARRDWKRLDQLADWRPEHSLKPNPDLLAPAEAETRRPRRWPMWGLAAACLTLLAVGAWRLNHSSPTAAPEAAVVAKPENRHILPDGSVVKLNDGASFAQLYADGERRVRLVRGEAFFIVAKDARRPFIVDVGANEVRAVGTAFNIRLGPDEVDVVVAEGVVAVSPSAGPAAEPSASTRLEAYQRISLPLAAPVASAPIVTLSHRDIQRALAWQHGMMTFQEKSLADIAAELNRLNDTQILLADEHIARMKFSGTIYSDNLDGFARLLETGFGAGVARTPEGHFELRTRAQEN